MLRLTKNTQIKTDGDFLTTKRIEWVDYAKGIAIIMVVIHHVVVRDTGSVLYSGVLDYLNDLFQTFRMPLFFFVSGLFIHKTINSNFKHFFKFKISRLLYLFVLWSIIRYLTVTIPEHALTGSSDESLISILYIFVEPSGMLWFIYALAIFLTITWLTSAFPAVTLCFAMILYVLTIQMPADNHFINQLAQFYPFYLLGYFTSSTAHKIAYKVKGRYLIIPILLITLLVITKDTTFSEVPLGIFILSCCSVLTGIIISAYLTKFKRLKWLGAIGRNTLPIYLMHYFPIGVLRVMLAPILPYPIVTAIIIFVVALFAPLIAARLFNKLNLNWLLEAPHLIRQEQRKFKSVS